MNAIACIIITNDFKENKLFLLLFILSVSTMNRCCPVADQRGVSGDQCFWMESYGLNLFVLGWKHHPPLLSVAVKRKFWKLRSSLQKLKDVSMIWYTSMYYLYYRWPCKFSICGTALHSSFMPTKMHQMQLISIIYLSNITQWFWI